MIDIILSRTQRAPDETVCEYCSALLDWESIYASNIERTPSPNNPWQARLM